MYTLFFVVINYFFFFSHITQHSIQNITKQNNRHILSISRSNQKGGREGRTRTQKSLLYTITYINKKHCQASMVEDVYTLNVCIQSAKTMGLIYETNVRPKFGRTVVSTQNLEFINMDVSGGYDQISRQV